MTLSAPEPAGFSAEKSPFTYFRATGVNPNVLVAISLCPHASFSELAQAPGLLHFNRPDLEIVLP